MGDHLPIGAGGAHLILEMDHRVIAQSPVLVNDDNPGCLPWTVSS